jgi:hypothetical protein
MREPVRSRRKLRTTHRNVNKPNQAELPSPLTGHNGATQKSPPPHRRRGDSVILCNPILYSHWLSVDPADSGQGHGRRRLLVSEQKTNPNANADRFLAFFYYHLRLPIAFYSVLLCLLLFYFSSTVLAQSGIRTHGGAVEKVGRTAA